jgi:hypothetical protein
MSDPRDDLAALVASRRGVTAKVNDTDRWVADAIIAAGYVKPKPPKVYPPHDIDVERAPYCTVCGRDAQWGTSEDGTEGWAH